LGFVVQFFQAIQYWKERKKERERSSRYLGGSNHLNQRVSELLDDVGQAISDDGLPLEVS